MDLTDIHGIGEAIAAQLKAQGITSIADLAQASDKKLERLQIKRVNIKRLRGLRDEARAYRPEAVEVDEPEEVVEPEAVEVVEPEVVEVVEPEAVAYLEVVKSEQPKASAYPARFIEGTSTAYAPCVVLFKPITPTANDQRAMAERAIDRWNNSSPWPNIFAVTERLDCADVIVEWHDGEMDIVAGNPAIVLLPIEVDENSIAQLLGITLGVQLSDGPYDLMNGGQRAAEAEYEAAAHALWKAQQLD